MIKKFIIVLAMIFVFDLIGSFSWLFYVIGQEASDKPFKADAAIVFMGDFNKDYSALGRQTLRRLNYALELKKEGEFSEFLCVGGARPKINAYGADLMAQYLYEHGISLGDVDKERLSYDTKTNWSYAKEIIKNKSWKSVILVTSPLHMFRVRQIIKQDPLNSAVVYYAPLNYMQARPAVSFIELYQKVHYEWAAYLAQILPLAWYDRIIEKIRHQ